MRQANLLGSLWLCLFSLGSSGCSPGEAPSPGHNLILICADTLRSDHLGMHGYGLGTSPNLDALASAGMRFERCFSTYPQTAASVASIFTSLYPSGHKVSEQEMLLSPLPAVLAESLQQAGYRTGAVVTNPHLTPGLGFERGFQSYTYIYGRNQERSSHATQQESSRAGVSFRQSKGSYYGRGDDVNQTALEWLDADAGKRPFYLYLHYMDVHSPYISPAPFQDRFVRAEGQNVYQNGKPKGNPSQANIDFTRARYDGGVAYLDACIGELKAELESRGLLPNTYLLFTADHGDEFMEHGGFGHGQTLYRELTQVPLIVTGPGVPAALHASPVSGVDLYPTICELLGVPAPATLQGQSLAQLLRPGAAKPGPLPTRSYAEAQTARMRDGELQAAFSLYDERWHLIQRSASGTRELYDYRADPGEERDLAGQEAMHVERLARRALELQAAAQRLGAAFEGKQAELDAATQAQLDALGYGESPADED